MSILIKNISRKDILMKLKLYFTKDLFLCVFYIDNYKIKVYFSEKDKKYIRSKYKYIYKTLTCI